MHKAVQFYTCMYIPESVICVDKMYLEATATLHIKQLHLCPGLKASIV